MKHDHISTSALHLVITATAFKATCLDIFSRLADGTLARVTVTRRGLPVAELRPPETRQEAAEQLIGCMRGSVRLPAGLDLTEPVIDMTEWSPDLPE